MKTSILIRDCRAVKGATKAVLAALATYADRNGCNAFPAQATLADAAGYTVRTVQRALRELEDVGLIRRTGGRRSRRGRCVVVWRIVLAVLKHDTLADRPAKPLQKQKARQEKMGREAAFRILAARYGWSKLQEWSEDAIERAISRVSGMPLQHSA